MAGLENLFAAEPMLPSVQTSKLPDDPQQWAEVITTRLREKYPEVTRLPLTVEYRKKDDQSGTAIGSIHVVSPETQKTIYVPIIIRKFELFPLDIWMEAKTQDVHPLTNDTFKEQFFVQSPAESLDQRPQDSAGQYFNDPSLWTTNYPPLQGRYSYASAGYTLLDVISDTLRKEHLDEFRKNLEKNAHLLLKFKKHGHQEIIEKLAKKVAPNTNDFETSANKLIPIGAVSIKKEGPDKYSILSMADQLFDLAASENMDLKSSKEYLSRISPKPWDFLHELDQEGEKMVLVKSAPSEGVFLYDDIRVLPEAANEFAVYKVHNKAGMAVTGLVFPYVVNFAGKKQGTKLFVSATHSSMQGQVVGQKLVDTDHFLKLLKPEHGARVGQTGTFVFIDDGKAIATTPVTIKAIEEYGPMTAVLLDGTKIRIKRGFSDEAPKSFGEKGTKEKNFLDIHGMLETRPNEYTIPSRMQWIPMEGFQDVSSTVDEWLNKEASHRAEINPMVIRWTGIVFDVSGSGIEKTASLDERRTKLLLAVRGAPLDKIAQIMKKARATGRVKVHGLKPLRKKADIVKLASETSAQLKQLCDSVRGDFLKCAAEIDDATTVDMLLSLNFVNPDNLVKFISYRPVFEKVLDYLAELTLGCRLGIKDLNESALVMTLSKMEEILDGLKRMETALKKPGVKTASAKWSAEHTKANRAAMSYLTHSGALIGGMALGKAGERYGQRKATEKKMAGVKTAAAAPAPTKDDPFAQGMIDGEMDTHLYLERWKGDPKAMLAYLNGKRTAELNRASSAMGAGFAPPNGMKPAKPQPVPKAGGKK